MRKYYTHKSYIFSLRIIALIFAVISILMGIFVDNEAFMILISAGFIFLISFLYYFNMILIDDEFIYINRIISKGKYEKKSLKEIIIYGSDIRKDRSCVAICFITNEGCRKSYKILSNPMILKDLFSEFKGNIVCYPTLTYGLKQQLLKLGAKDEMF